MTDLNSAASAPGVWDSEWESIHQSERWGRYPSEHVVRFVARNMPADDRKAVRVLEIGCGQGAQIWYLAREGFDVSGVDGSETAVSKAKQRLAGEGLSADLRVADAARLEWPDEFFDLVLDIECLMCVPFDAARRVVEECRRVLKPGGWLFSQAFTHRTHVGEAREEVGRLTYRNVTGGQLARKRLIRLTDEQDISSLYGSLRNLGWEVASVTSAARRILSEEWLIAGQR